MLRLKQSGRKRNARRRRRKNERRRKKQSRSISLRHLIQKRIILNPKVQGRKYQKQGKSQVKKMVWECKRAIEKLQL